MPSVAVKKTIGERTGKKRDGEELFIGAGFMRSINMPYRIHRTGLGAFGEKYPGAVFRHTEWIVQREKRSGIPIGILKKRLFKA